MLEPCKQMLMQKKVMATTFYTGRSGTQIMIIIAIDESHISNNDIDNHFLCVLKPFLLDVSGNSFHLILSILIYS